jgi:phosphoribosylcarboxyaminoimidazole (NCAIR) mutase
MNMLLRNAVIPMGNEFVSDMCVRLENGCIVEIGKDLAANEDETVVDLGGDYLLPGFVDVHTHAYMGRDTMQGEEAVRHMSCGLYDVGVAGLHRLLAHVDEIQGASVVVAIAGMEGALASVLGGLASCPVIACPTSVGYGASLNGVAALLSMLNSCASGVSVVNIDNGFGAGYQAALIDHVGASAVSRA